LGRHIERRIPKVEALGGAGGRAAAFL